jgi:hypothetical protein
MVDNPAWKISERVAEVQALLDESYGGRHAHSRGRGRQAMFDVGYFPPNTPPDE